MDAGTRDVLVHIVDNFQDHFSEQKPTTAGFILGKSTWKSSGVDDEFKAKDGGTGEKWFAPLCLSYIINDKETVSKYMCLRGVYIELRPPISKKGKIAENFGSTWVNVHLPGPLLKSFSNRCLTTQSSIIMTTFLVLFEEF